MTEREKVLLQREAARKWNQYWSERSHIAPSTERHIRQCFPLPPKREPRVVRDEFDNEWRLNPSDGVMEVCYSGTGGDRKWYRWFSPSVENVMRQLLASPYIEVPDPEDTA